MTTRRTVVAASPDAVAALAPHVSERQAAAWLRARDEKVRATMARAQHVVLEALVRDAIARGELPAPGPEAPAA